MPQQAQQKAKTISEGAKKLLEKINEIYKRVCELTDQKKKLIDEYQERLKQIDLEIAHLFMEAGRILDELESQHGLSLSEIKALLTSIPDKFFKNAISTYRKSPRSADMRAAVEKAYNVLVSRDEDASSPAIIKAMRAIQRASPSVSEAIQVLAKKTPETFYCPLCNEEHVKETEYSTIHVCIHCKNLIEGALISMGVFKEHGRRFLLEWDERAKVNVNELRRKYINLLRYLKSRRISIPKEFMEAG